MSINQFLVSRKIDKKLHKQIKRYFRYIIVRRVSVNLVSQENKRDYKLEEAEVMEMLNENLKVELIVHLNGKMLHESPIFKYFSMTFLSELSLILKRETFSIGDTVLEEDTMGDRLHYVTKGNVVVIHKKSATFLMEVSIDTFIGELSFFTGKPRTASARSTNFTEVLTLYLSEFLEVAERHPKQLDTFNAIRRELRKA